MKRFYLNSLLGQRSIAFVLSVLILVGFSNTLPAQCSSVSSTITVSANSAPFELDANGDGIPDFSFSYVVAGAFISISINGLNGNNILTTTTGAGVLGAEAILMGEPICASDDFNLGTTLYNSSQGVGLVFAGSGGAFIGIMNGMNLGFMQIQVANTTSSSVMISYSQYSFGPGMTVSECGGIGVVAGDCDSVMPVELSSFGAQYLDYGIEIRWTTESELNNAGFYLERSLDGKNFDRLHWIEGHGTSIISREYQYNDLKLPAANNYYYRLQQMDTDHRAQYSDVVVVNSKLSNTIASPIYPNPATTMAWIDIDVSEQQAAKLSLFDATGESQIEFDLELLKGKNTIELPIVTSYTKVLFVKIQLEQTSIYRKLLLMIE